MLKILTSEINKSKWGFTGKQTVKNSILLINKHKEAGFYREISRMEWHYIGSAYFCVQPVNYYLPQIISDFLVFSPEKDIQTILKILKTLDNIPFSFVFCFDISTMDKDSFAPVIFNICTKILWLTWYDSFLFLFQLIQKNCSKLKLLVQL